MREGVVNLHFHHLGVDHDEAQLLGRVAEEEARDNGIDANALAASGGSRDEEVGHFGEVADDGVSVNIHAERQRKLRTGFAPGVLFEQLAQGHFHLFRVGDLDAHGVLARNRRENINALGAGGPGDVTLQRNDFVHTHSHIGINLVACDRRAFRDCAGSGLDAELRERVDDEMLVVFQLLAVEGLAITLILGIQQVGPGHFVILEVNIQQSGREGILRRLGGLEFRELGFLGRRGGRGGIDDFRLRKLKLLLLRRGDFRLGNFYALLLELAGELFSFLLKGLALFFHAALFIQSSQVGRTAGLPPGEKGFPSPHRIAHWVRGNREHQTADIQPEHEQNGCRSQNAVHRFLADPQTEKTAWALDAEFPFPILQEPRLDLDQACPQQHHQQPPPHLVAQAVVGHKPLREPVADAGHRQEVGRGSEEK